MVNITLYELHSQNKTMRCLRFYEAPIENAWLLIGIVSGINCDTDVAKKHF